MAASSNQLWIVVCFFLLRTLPSVASFPDLGMSSGAQNVPTTERPLVRNVSEVHGDSYGRPGLSHLTIAGALQHGLREVEMWLQTFAPGSGTPIHRHDCEEIFLVLKGKGTLYLAPPASDVPYPGRPDEFSINANSTFIIPVNSIHQVRNNEEGDLQLIAVISRPPVRVFTYADWYTPHVEAIDAFPYPWDADLFREEQCGASFSRGPR